MGVRGPWLEPWPRATGSHIIINTLHVHRICPRLAPRGSFILSLPLACTPGAFPSVPPACTPGVFGPLRPVGGCRTGRMCTPGCGGLGFGAQARAHTPVPCQSAYLFQKRSPNCLSCAPRLCSGSSCATDRAERHRSAAADRSAPSASVVQLVGGSQQAAARAARAHPGRGLAGTAAAPSAETLTTGLALMAVSSFVCFGRRLGVQTQRYLLRMPSRPARTFFQKPGWP